MPVWTPGSYLIREYSRHLAAFTVEAPGRAAKVRKNAWQIETGGAARVVIRYRVYAGELTVRTNHVDESHAFLVGAALFLGVEGHEELGARVEVVAPRGWRAATSLPSAPPHGVGDEVLRFEAPTFDALVDSPIELGTHREERFEAVGVPHRYSLWPAKLVSDADARRLVDDTRTILETEAKLFGGTLPYDTYELLLHLSPRGRGGLEHNASAALIAAPGSFATRDGYLDLLSLVAHEAFHVWNIKRIRPAELTPYRYGQECYTRLLWWFEGGTSYYDWRVLALSRLCTVDEYLDHLASEIAYLDQTPGRLVHALEDASYDAWIKLYRPDENSQNSSVSYYRKGEVVCALLRSRDSRAERRQAPRSMPCSPGSGKSTAPGLAPYRRTRCSRSSSGSPGFRWATSSTPGSAPRSRSIMPAPSRASGSPSTERADKTRPPARSACGCARRAGALTQRRCSASRGPGAQASTPATRSSPWAGPASKGPTSRPPSAGARRATRSRSWSCATGASSRRRSPSTLPGKTG